MHAVVPSTVQHEQSMWREGSEKVISNLVSDDTSNYTLQRAGGGRLGADFVRTLATRR